MAASLRLAATRQSTMYRHSRPKNVALQRGLFSSSTYCPPNHTTCDAVESKRRVVDSFASGTQVLLPGCRFQNVSLA